MDILTKNEIALAQNIKCTDTRWDLGVSSVTSVLFFFYCMLMSFCFLVLFIEGDKCGYVCLFGFLCQTKASNVSNLNNIFISGLSSMNFVSGSLQYEYILQLFQVLSSMNKELSVRNQDVIDYIKRNGVDKTCR